jgi:hypothetical protein
MNPREVNRDIFTRIDSSPSLPVPSIGARSQVLYTPRRALSSDAGPVSGLPARGSDPPEPAVALLSELKAPKKEKASLEGSRTHANLNLGDRKLGET